MSELTPVTRKEQFYDRILQAAESGGGGGGSTLIEKSISANGIYNASDDSADGYSKVTVDVSNTYTAEDEGKVVDNGALVAQTAMSSEVTENGTVDTTLYNSVTVNVPSGGAEFSNSPTTFNLVKNIRNLDLVIPDGVTAIEQGAFVLGVGIKSVVLPNTISKIPKNCFQDCNGLTNVEIPNGVATLENQCFLRCTNLEEIKLPNTLKTIGQNALSGCSKLKNLTIPSSVTFFGSYACSGLSSLETLKFEATTPISLSVDTVFDSLPTTCIIYVPTGSLTAYTSAANYPDSNTYTYVEY